MNEFISTLSAAEWLLSGIALLCFLMNAGYWLAVLSRVAMYRIPPAPAAAAQPPVSIILSARNEYRMLEKNLPLILAQDYPEYEVIVVNDCSEDDSELLLASMQRQYPHLVFRTIVKDEVFRHGKKMPLGMGIKAARYDLFLFTDADCRPSSNRWLQRMQQGFTTRKDLVLGYTRPDNVPKWMRADRFMQALDYLGKALTGRAFMGTNSNLAYRRQLFFDNKGFDVRVTEHLREDIVFVGKTATNTNTSVVLGADSTTVGTLHFTPREWRRSRVHELDSLALSGRSRYPGLGEAITRCGFFAALITAAILCALQGTPSLLFLPAGLWLLRFALTTAVFCRSQKRLEEQGLLPTLWWWDLVSPLYYACLIFLCHFKRKKSWR